MIARPGNCWYGLLEYFQPLDAQTVLELREPSGITTRMRKALDKSGAHWINGCHEYNWDGAGRLQHYPRRSTT